MITRRRVAARWAAWERHAGRFGAVPAASTAGPVPPADTFPATDLQCRVWIALTPDYTLPWWQWGWANITEYVRWDPGITVTDGRRDESGTVSTINASMVLENDGRFSRRNPFSPYYGFLTRNTPVWAQVNPGSGWYDRLHGYINAWPKRWDTTGTDSVVPVSIGGIKRRLDSDDVEKSPMARTCAGPTAEGITPIGYWPMEDGANATQFASALPGGETAVLGGVTALAVSDLFPGSQPLPVWPEGAVTRARVPAHTDVGRWAVQIASHMPTNGGVSSSGVVRVFHAAGDITVGPNMAGTSITIVIRDLSGTVLDIDTPAVDADLILDQSLSYVITAVDDASGTDDYFYTRILNSSGDIVFSYDYNAGAGRYGKVVSASPGGLLHNYSGMALGHLQVFADAAWDKDTSGATAAEAMGAWDTERLTDRLARVCREEGIPFAAYAGDEAATLGPQPTGSTSAVLADAEKAGRGVVYEHEFGLAYKSPRDYNNQPVHFAVDQAQGQLAEYVEADDDDQVMVNQWTAKRTDGSSSTYRDPAYVAGDALFAGGDTYNVETDGQLPDIAGWEVHKGTVDEDRWPMLAVNLANHPELIPQWTGMPFGGRVQVTNPHEEVGVDVIDAIREGRTEHWNSKQWTARMNTTPASTHTVGVWGDDTGSNTESRWGVNNSTLVTAVSDTATALTVTAPGEPWVTGDTGTDTVNFPLDVDIGGLTYACTSIAGVLFDGFDRTVADSWGTDPGTGLTWSVVSGTAADHSVASSRAQHNMATRNVNYTGLIDAATLGVASGPNDITLPIRPGVVATGADFRVAIETRSSGSSSSWARWDVEFRTSGVLAARHRRAISGAQTNFDYTIFPFTYGASDVVWLRLRLDGDDMYGKCWVGAITDEPARLTTQIGGATGVPPGTQFGVRTFINSSNSNVLPLLVEFDNIRINDPYTFTVTRLATDKPHAAGAPVTVTDTGTWGI